MSRTHGERLSGSDTKWLNRRKTIRQWHRVWPTQRVVISGVFEHAPKTGALLLFIICVGHSSNSFGANECVDLPDNLIELGLLLWREGCSAGERGDE